MSKYKYAAKKIGDIVTEKNTQYGDAINNVDAILKILYPEGIPVEDMKDASVIVRLIDKLFRITRGNQGNENAWVDITGYGLLMSTDSILDSMEIDHSKLNNIDNPFDTNTPEKNEPIKIVLSSAYGQTSYNKPVNGAIVGKSLKEVLNKLNKR